MFENEVSINLIIVTIVILVAITAFGVFFVNKFKEKK